MRSHSPRTSRRAFIVLATVVATTLTGGNALSATSEATVTITGGSLGLTTTDFAGQSATVTGAQQVLNATASSPWSAVDARGTGAPWSVVATASDMVSAPDRTIPSSQLAITTGAVTATAGADASSGITGSTSAPFTTPTGPGETAVTLLAAPGPHRGTYEFSPGLAITLPPTVEPSYPGEPYTSTLTITIS